MSTPLIVSASRRTDMPRFFLDTLEREVRERVFRWHHPFTHQLQELALAPDQEVVLVLWSKDFGRFLAHASAFQECHLFFHFTLTTSPPALEPNLPPLSARLGQMERLVARWGAEAVRWRFDPVVVWEEGGQRHTNLVGIEALAQEVASLGVREVTVSFMDRYRKIDRRTSGGRIRFLYPSPQEAVRLFAPFAQLLSGLGFTVLTCCEDALCTLPGVQPGGCIDAVLLSSLTGLSLDATPDQGQRRSLGCRCHKSVDVGCYVHHTCPGGCLYCYARP